VPFDAETRQSRVKLAATAVQPTVTADSAQRPTVTAKRVVGGTSTRLVIGAGIDGPKQPETGNERGVETAITGSW
jgi:hypothetical protein